MTPREVASQNWTHVDSVTGKTLTWHQENEAAVKSKQEAIAVLQRTLDFWLPKMRDDTVSQKQVPLDFATMHVRNSIRVMLKKELAEDPTSFASRFGVTVDDLDWSI